MKPVGHPAGARCSRAVRAVSWTIAVVLLTASAPACITATLGGGGDEEPPPTVDAGDVPVPDAQLPIPDAGPSPDAAPCVEGDENIVSDGTCYMFFATPLTWDEARVDCEGRGGHLAVITSPGENAIIGALGRVDSIDAWLGGTDVAQEMAWLWVTSEPMEDYTNWRDMEPNNGNDNGPENCMIIELDMMGTWDDRRCGQTYSYFCERL